MQYQYILSIVKSMHCAYLKNKGGFMTTYTLNLTPALRNFTTEGGLDTSLLNGVSLQRTGYIDVYNGTDRKIVQVNDGESFNDTMQTLEDLGIVG